MWGSEMGRGAQAATEREVANTPASEDPSLWPLTEPIFLVVGKARGGASGGQQRSTVVRGPL